MGPWSRSPQVVLWGAAAVLTSAAAGAAQPPTSGAAASPPASAIAEGHRLYRLARYEDALQQFEAASVSASVPERVDAWRMIGQIQVSRRNEIGAAAAYRAAIDLILAEPDRRGLSAQFRMCAFGLSQIRQSQQQWEEAIGVRTLLLTTPGIRVGREFLPTLYLENSRDSRRLARWTEAVGWIDRLLTEFPDYGQADGSIVDVLYERVLSRGLSRSSPEYADAVLALWRDPGLRSSASIYRIGHHAATTLLDGLGCPEASAEVFGELSQRLEAAWPSLSAAQQSDLSSIRIDAMYGQAYGLDRAGRRVDAIVAYTHVVSVFPGTRAAERSMRRIQQLLLPPPVWP